ncbi:ribosomal protein S16 [Cryptococcus sp. DSM 104549]
MPIVRLRLALHGTKRNPLFHIVAIASRRARNARPLEHLGVYDPVPRVPAGTPIPAAFNVHLEGGEAEAKQQATITREKRLELDTERIRWWLKTGAQPTRSMVRLLEMGGVLTRPHKWQKGNYTPPVKTEPVPAEKVGEVAAGEAAKVKA